MEKLKDFKIKNQKTIIGGNVYRTYIASGQSTPPGLDFYDDESGRVYNIVGQEMF